MSQETGSTAARGLWPALAACLLDFEAFPGRYPLALREPRLLFDHGTEVLTLACDRVAEGLPQDEALEAQLRQAARFFVRTAMLRPGADHYTLMGLTPAYEPGKLRDHYRMLMRLTHPDFSGGGRAWPADAATRINQANDVLSSVVSRQEYDRTLGGARQPWRPSPPGPALVRARPRVRERGGDRLAASSGHRRVVLGTLTVAGLLALGAWLVSGTGEHEADATVAAVSASSATPAPGASAPLGGHGEVAAPSAVPKPPGASLAQAEPRPEGAPPLMAAASATAQPRPVPAVTSQAANESGLALRPSPGLNGYRSGAAPVQPLSAGRDPAPAPLAAPAVAAVGMPVAPVALAAVAAPPPGLPAAAPVAPPEALVPVTRLSMDDVQPLLGHVLGALQSGRGEQVLRWVERPTRPGDGADGFVQTYNRAVGNARAVRVGAVRFDGRPAVEGLQVEGVVLLHVQDENLQAATHELVLRAQFASKGGQAVLTRLNASETLR